MSCSFPRKYSVTLSVNCSSSDRWRKMLLVVSSTARAARLRATTSPSCCCCRHHASGCDLDSPASAVWAAATAATSVPQAFRAWCQAHLASSAAGRDRHGVERLLVAVFGLERRFLISFAMSRIKSTFSFSGHVESIAA
jgi:hypothetical protein